MFRRLREPAATVGIVVDGRPLRAAAGDTVAAALLSAGVAAFRRTPRLNATRGHFCGMGACFDCLVAIDGAPNRQACLVEVREGMVVTTGCGRPDVAGGSSS
jgi:predicted molibdopterin-dependent oxidoreductase YjgC